MYSLPNSSQWKSCILLVCLLLGGISGEASEVLHSPNGKIAVSVDHSWKDLKVSYKKGNKMIPVLHINDVGLQLLHKEGDFVYTASSSIPIEP